MSLRDTLFGKALASDEAEAQRIGVLAGVAMLGLDALSSAAYGPEAAMTILIPLGSAAVGYITPITGVIVALLFVVYLSYRQTIGAYPRGGGSYTVARENLGDRFGLLAAAALLIDYVLVVAVGISAGVGALVSAVPTLQPHPLAIGLGLLALIAAINLRGVRESGAAFILPTIAFVGSLGLVLALGAVRAWLAGWHPAPMVAPAALPRAVAPAGAWILARAFASGCTAMTGVEAVSNAVPVFEPPAVARAQRALGIIIGILILLLGGIALLSVVYRVGATEPGSASYQSVLSELVGAIAGRGALYYVTMASILAVLASSANTAFAGFPRLCRLLAEDGFLPRVFASRGRRLVYSIGISALTLLSAALLAGFGGLTDPLIPLFAIGAFLAFTLSQAGMVSHWRRAGGRGATTALAVNAVGALATGATTLVVVVAKFVEGAWVVVIVIPVLLMLFTAVSRHYRRAAIEIRNTAPLDLSGLTPPIVVVPMASWNRMSQRGLRFACQLSPQVLVAQVVEDETRVTPLAEGWPSLVDAPARAAGRPAPQLVSIASPYRHVVRPLLDFILETKKTNPGRQVAVVIPELVARSWYEAVLHNQRASLLKGLLLVRGGDDVIVINVPWYLRT